RHSSVSDLWPGMMIFKWNCHYDFWDKSSNFKDFAPPKNGIEIILLSLVCYILGHLIFSLYSTLELLLSKFIKQNENLLNDIEIFNKFKEGYTEFVERYNVLFQMRINLATTFIIFFVICLIYDIDNKITVLNLISGILMFILAVLTKKDYNKILTKLINK
ncbi:MAG: hypothetical protein JXB48_20215, partial [Candidatus Latescibacteria bacterium]|nr:hypothetical protein [Candidatus Latescibacterota bacterium]